MEADKTLRLDKLIANNTQYSRSEAKRMIRAGRVTVNGEVALRENTKIRPHTDTVSADGQDVPAERNATFIMNKAAGDVCSTVSDSHPTVYERLSPADARRYAGGALSTAGRLDADTEGLLIITSDGDLIHRITSPRSLTEKTYLVYLRGSVTDSDKARYRESGAQGVHIAAEGKAKAADTSPFSIEWKDKSLYDCTQKGAKEACFITVTEGKFHEVKRIFRALGNEVVYLKRIRIGGLWLPDSLEPGTYRRLTDAELNLLPASKSGTQST